jgi:hypothetical protein
MSPNYQWPLDAMFPWDVVFRMPGGERITLDELNALVVRQFAPMLAKPEPASVGNRHERRAMAARSRKERRR